MASFNYRAGKYKRVKKALLFTMGCGFAMIICFALPGMIFPEFIVSLFQKDQAVREIGAEALQYASFGIIFLALSVPINMLYQSIRKPAMSSFLSLLRSGLTFIPVLLLTSWLWGLTGIQISQPVADVLTGLISIPFIIIFLIRTPNEDRED